MKLLFSYRPSLNIKLIFQKLSVVFVFYFLLVSPFILLIIHFSHRIGRFEETEGVISRLAIRMEQIKQSQKEKVAFTDPSGEIDHCYISRFLESMAFLKPEVKALELVCSHPAFQTCESIKNRLEKLTRGENCLVFFEGNREAKNGIEEVELCQSQCVEINADDLKKILSVVEGVFFKKESPPKGRPQLIVKRFDLNKKNLAERETYLLEMDLIKREYLK